MSTAETEYTAPDGRRFVAEDDVWMNCTGCAHEDPDAPDADCLGAPRCGISRTDGRSIVWVLVKDGGAS